MTMRIIESNTAELTTHHTDVFKLIQITDTHIQEKGTDLFNGFDTSASLQQVIKALQENETDADCLLITGDLVNVPTEAAYQELADILASVKKPVFWLPGNHDNPELMDYVLGKNSFDTCKIIQANNWRVILVNSHLMGEHAGEITEEEYHFLETALNESKESNILIALHHHPISINSLWMDSMMLTNPEKLLELIEQHKQVKGVIWGHIHQQFEMVINEVHFLGSPSTCIQFKPKATAYEADKKSPGYQSLNMFNSGNIKSKVIYL